MHYLLTVLCLLAACAASHAWYNRFDNAVYGGWAPDRRSISGCSETFGRCIKKHQCCNRNDVCMIEFNSRLGFGLCKPKHKILDAYNYGEKFGFKKEDEECQDSIECADQCCRPVKMSRMGKKMYCGKPDENSSCIGRVYNLNDILGGY